MWSWSTYVIGGAVAAALTLCLALSFGWLGLAVGAILGGAYLSLAEELPRRFRAAVNCAAFAVIFGLALCLTIAEANAAETRPLVDTVSEAMQPIVQLVVGTAVTAFLGWIYARLSQWFGIKVDAGHRETLHSALTTSANLMLSRVAMAGKAGVAEGVIQVWSGARDAIKHFGINDETLEKMLRAKIQENDVAGISEPTPGGSAIVARRPNAAASQAG